MVKNKVPLQKKREKFDMFFITGKGFKTKFSDFTKEWFINIYYSFFTLKVVACGIFQVYTPASKPDVAQDWITSKFIAYIGKNEYSPELNSLACYIIVL